MASCHSRTSLSVASLHCTTPRQTEHNTELSVHYAWHPWVGQIVQFVARVDRRPELRFRVDRVVCGKSKRIDIPAWMFDRAICAAMVKLDGAPYVPFLVLRSFKDLISSTLPELEKLKQERSPSLTRGNAHGKKKKRLHDLEQLSLFMEGSKHPSLLELPVQVQRRVVELVAQILVETLNAQKNLNDCKEVVHER